MLLRAGGERDQLPGLLLVGEDLSEIPVAEPAGVSAALQRVVDLVAAVQFGEVDRLGHLAPHPLRTRGARLDQPCFGTVAQSRGTLAPRSERARGRRSSAPAGLGG